MQYWTFLKYLPLILGRFVASDNKNWHFLLHLSHVVDLIFAPKFTTDMITYLRSIVEDHLTEYISLYGNQGAVKLRPKHHFLVHLPTIILKCGPLIGMSCLRCELKNSFFKHSAHIVCNFNNICRTLAYHHQQRALFSLLADAHCHSAPLVAQQKMVVVSSLPYVEHSWFIWKTSTVRNSRNSTLAIDRDKLLWKDTHVDIMWISREDPVNRR